MLPRWTCDSVGEQVGEQNKKYNLWTIKKPGSWILLINTLRVCWDSPCLPASPWKTFCAHWCQLPALTSIITAFSFYGILSIDKSSSRASVALLGLSQSKSFHLDTIIQTITANTFHLQPSAQPPWRYWWPLAAGEDGAAKWKRPFYFSGRVMEPLMQPERMCPLSWSAAPLHGGNKSVKSQPPPHQSAG